VTDARLRCERHDAGPLTEFRLVKVAHNFTRLIGPWLAQLTGVETER